MFWKWQVSVSLTLEGKKRKWGYPVAAHDVVNVVAKLGGTSTNTGTEAEFGVRYETCPFVVLSSATEAVSVDQTTN